MNDSLRQLAVKEWGDELEKFPPGSLAHLYTPQRNAEEATLVRGCSLLVEHEQNEQNI